MTVTVEGFYRDLVDVKILARRLDDDAYARKRAIAARLTPGKMDGLSRYYSAGFR